MQCDAQQHSIKKFFDQNTKEAWDVVQCTVDKTTVNVQGHIILHRHNQRYRTAHMYTITSVSCKY